MKPFKNFILTRKVFLLKGLLSVLLLALAGQTLAQTCVSPPPGLVGWWDGDSVNGNIAFDISGGNNGALMNGATTALGLVGRAFEFNGIDQFIEVPDSISLELTTNGTLGAWVFHRSPYNMYKYIIDKGPISWLPVPGEGGTYAMSAAGPAHLYTANPSGGSTLLAGYVPLNTWTYMVGTWDGSNMKMYLNGNLVGVVPQTYTPLPGNRDSLRFGTTREYGTGEDFDPLRFFDGFIDEIEIYNRALSADEVAAIFNAGSEGKCKLPSYRCVGFQSPADKGAMTVNKNRAIPLKAEIFDKGGNAVLGGNPDFPTPPAISVSYQQQTGPATDVTTEALPVGVGTVGNQFEFLDGVWQYNLKTTNYTSPGTYTLTLVPGNTTYAINPVCTSTFVLK